MLTGLNHITLATKDLSASLDFYTLLGFEQEVRWINGAYLSLNDFWLCLSLGSVDKKADYSHIAFSIEEADFPKIEALLAQNNIRQWQPNESEGNSIYLLDPSGHKLELHVGSLQSRLRSLEHSPYEGMIWLK